MIVLAHTVDLVESVYFKDGIDSKVAISLRKSARKGSVDEDVFKGSTLIRMRIVGQTCSGAA